MNLLLQSRHIPDLLSLFLKSEITSNKTVMFMIHKTVLSKSILLLYFINTPAIVG